jgi:structural maintenance of chromosome 3 (chondroitin sulfate proteoglycan 6)
LPVAAQYARSHGCSAITPEGDTANKKGAMTGGYIDPRKSRIEAVRTVNRWREEYDSLKQRSVDVRKEVEQKEQEITAAMGELHKLEQKLNRFDDSFEPLTRELRGKSSHLEKQRDQLEANLKRREVVEKLIKDYGDNLSSFEAELGTDFKKALTANEELQLEQLNTTVQDLQKQWNDLSKSRRELESQKQLLEVDLRENLRMKLDQLNSQEIDTTAGSGSGNLKESQRELKRVQKAAAAVESRLEENETQVEEAEQHIAGLQKQVLLKAEKQQELARAIEKNQKRMEKSVAKKALLTTAAAECAKNIRDLGVLPEEAFEKYANIDSKTVSTLYPHHRTSVANMIQDFCQTQESQ